ncbi:MAG: TonB-dependent receptor domain-containing protein [Bacteroidota bacterium]
MKKLIVIAFVLLSCYLSAQNGTLRGKVFDAETGESLVGVTVLVKELSDGAITDLDGKFSRQLKAGTYELRLSYISYQTITITDVVVKPNEVTVLNNLTMAPSHEELEGIVVTAEVIRSSENALTTIKRKSNAIMDGVSAERMKLSGDGTAAEAVKRVTGVSVEGGKYFYVRGLGDRYSKSMLNDVDVPGLDPDRNTLQMDIFPSSLISNMVVKKNFTADLPADFTGGLLNIEMKDFPDEKILDASLSLSYNPSMHFNPNYLTYQGGQTDFLGFDDGTRALPDRAQKQNIPTPISGASAGEVRDFIQSFDSQLGATQQTSLMDVSAGFSIGDQINLNSAKDNPAEDKLGYIFSLSYKSDMKYYDNVRYGEYQKEIDAETTELKRATLQSGQMGEHNVLVGLMGGLAYKNQLSKIRLTAVHLQNGSRQAGQFDIDNNSDAVGQSGYRAYSDNLSYNQRSLTNVLLSGNHVLGESGWKIDWKLSPTLSRSDDPDIRKTAFTINAMDTSFNAGAGGNPARIWRSLSEINATAKADVSKAYTFQNSDAEFSMGFSHTWKHRDYEILIFDMQFFGSQSWSNPDANDVLNPDNIYPNSPNAIYYQSGNSFPNPNEYQSNVNNLAFYVSNEMELFTSFKLITGLRMENYVQRHTGRDQQYASGDVANGRNLDNEKVLESLDLFPSVNAIYALTREQNLRAAYSRTIARPSFKELSFAQILDPLSNRIFNGTLFPYSNWDGELTETRINNFDLRWELYQKQGQLISLSAFYKQFSNPIELVRIPEQQTSTEYQPRNVGDGQLLGLEFEFRKHLDFISPIMKNFNVSGNLTLVESQIAMSDDEYQSRLSYQKKGEGIDDNRQMAGQSPYVVNVGVVYSNADAGFEMASFYNVKGPTLTVVGGGLFPDIYIEPFQSLNVSMIKKLGAEGNTTVDVNVSNLLNSERLSVYKAYNADDQIYSGLNPGVTLSVGVSHSF